MTVGYLDNEELIGLGETLELEVLCQLRRQLGQPCPYEKSSCKPLAGEKQTAKRPVKSNKNEWAACACLSTLSVIGCLVVV